MEERPWKWGEGGKVTLQLEKGPTDFKLVPVDPPRVERFRQDLAVARKITMTLEKAQAAFENGSAEYNGATRRLKKLVAEIGKAMNEQLEAAQRVGTFFVPAGIEKEFGALVDLITEFSAETIERLMEVHAKPVVKLEGQAPPDGPPGNGSPKAELQAVTKE